MAFMPIYIERSGDLIECYHSGKTHEQGKIELLSQWTMEGWDEQYFFKTGLRQLLRNASESIPGMCIIYTTVNAGCIHPSPIWPLNVLCGGATSISVKKKAIMDFHLSIFNNTMTIIFWRPKNQKKKKQVEEKTKEEKINGQSFFHAK